MIKYYKLFDLLNRNGMKKTDLLDIISAPTIAKLTKGETVKTDIIDKICIKLQCQPEDIMEAYEIKRREYENGEIEEYKILIPSEATKRQMAMDDEIREQYESYWKTVKEIEKIEKIKLKKMKKSPAE